MEQIVMPFVRDVVMPLLAMVITSLATVAVAYLMLYIKKKTGIDVAEGLRDKINAAAMTAVMAVEEKGAEKLDKGIGEWSSSMKLEKAMSIMKELVPEASVKTADAAIHKTIAQIPATGKTGDLFKEDVE